jgi:hypothetical protein
LKEYVQHNSGKHITATDDKLSFAVGLQGWSWEKFAQIEKGEFILTDETISFRAYMYRMLIIVLSMSLFLMVVSGEWFVGLLCFAWLYGGNVVVAIVKYRRMVKNIAENMGRPTSEPTSANRVFMK